MSDRLSSSSPLKSLAKNPLKVLFAQGKTVIGVIIGFNSPAMVELLALSGFDYVLFDCEHGAMSIESVESLTRAAEAAGITPLARVPSNKPSTILRFLDAGVMGLLVPHIETAEDARKAVLAMKYPPLGERGFGPIRASGHGARGSTADYLKWANEETIFLALVESVQGRANVEAIANTPGVDVVQIGPTDLSMSMGLSGQTDHPDVQRAIDEIIAIGKGAGKIVGSGAIRGSDAVGRAEARGIGFISLSARDLVFESARGLLGALESRS